MFTPAKSCLLDILSPRAFIWRIVCLHYTKRDYRSLVLFPVFEESGSSHYGFYAFSSKNNFFFEFDGNANWSSSILSHSPVNFTIDCAGITTLPSHSVWFLSLKFLSSSFLNHFPRFLEAMWSQVIDLMDPVAGCQSK